ncbi:MAG: DUF5020 family protein [Bacteroidales bacterium]|nr:DUF5020 family protein [Bacteroidales bacterium]
MKRFYTLFVIVLFACLSVKSQNLQMHYDFSSERQFFTSTLEMFRPDSLGSTFWFIDFDFNSPDKPRGISMAYWEIARDFYIPGLKNISGLEELSLHIEYNDGVQIMEADSAVTGFNLNSTWLAGFGYPVKIGNVVLGTQLLYKRPRGAQSADFQFTVTWFQPLLKNQFVFTGFMDLWSQDKILEDGKELVFQAEPQLWYAMTKKLFIGSELEISKNFPFGPADWKFQPTLAMKWEF